MANENMDNGVRPGQGTTHAPGVVTNIKPMTNGSEEQLSALQQLRRSVGITSDRRSEIAEMNLVTSFNGRRLINDDLSFFVKGIPYVFMTCPVLNLCEANVTVDSFLGYMATSTDQNKYLLKCLTYSESSLTDSLYGQLGTGAGFNLIPIITNTAISIDIKDTVARTKEVGETFYGYKQVHPGSLVDSIVGDEISIKYLELSNLPIIKMHKVWQDYIEKVRRGIFIPSERALSDGFIDYMASIYYFLCDFDGTTIKYWAKYTGVAPLNVPYSSLGGDFNSHEVPDVTINYSYCYKEDMSVAILRDFNRLALRDTNSFNWDDNGTEERAGGDIINRSPKGNNPSVYADDDATGGYIFKLDFGNN